MIDQLFGLGSKLRLPSWLLPTARIRRDRKAPLPRGRLRAGEVPDEEVIAAILAVPMHRAGNKFAADVSGISTGTAVKSLLQLIAAANIRVKVSEISISFNGVSNTATPILVEVVRQTSGGTFTNTTTLRHWDPSYSETLQTTCKDTASAEPTDSGDVPMSEYVHPQTGFLWQAPFGGELIIAGGARLGVRVTAAASVSANVRVVAEE